ncbi:MAG TPA: NAD(P)/FAD-dependent oxidoreductase [Actinomycetota bacterium]|jgi:flavin-dependent dehydrogenase
MSEQADRHQHYDVIVVGGGPAGSCTAGLLAAEGRHVLLLEREKFPRYHIGESLITGVWPTLDRLGVRERLEGLGFVRKYGASVLWGRDEEFWGFKFRQAGPYEYVHQVPRAEFDAVLLSRARELGVRVIEDATAQAPLLEGDRVAGVRYRVRGADDEVEARATVTVDASGQQRWLGRQLQLVQWHEDLRNIAVWGYYQGCRRYEGERSGDTLIERLPGGWLWFIPLGHDTTSVGYVTPVALMTASGRSPQDLLAEAIADSAEVATMMHGATMVSSHRTIRDWSYACTRFHGPGWALVGDAAAFVDPLLSTGVALAVRGARFAALAIGRLLDDPAVEEEVLEAYERNSRTFLNYILEFVRFFYDQTKGREEYHAGAQEIIDPEKQAPPEFDFVKLVSGLACEDAELEMARPATAAPVL